MKRIALLITVLLLFSGIASSEETDTKTLIIKAKNSMDSGRYTEAIEGLSAAYERMPIIGDYILLWLSKSYYKIDNLAESNSKIKELLTAYPDSPLKKKARSMEVKNLISLNDPALDLYVFESYIKDYPEDYEIKFLFAQFLKKRGNIDSAKTIFKNIYVNSNGILSKMACGELAPSDISLQELIDKATNLIDAMEFKEAEYILREALSVDKKGQYKYEILKRLGNALFKQKRYKESADAYEKAGDYYWRAKALYRAGERDVFAGVLKKLVGMKDRRAGSLLLLSASDKRRSGKIDEALSIYEDVKSNYPSESENAAWAIGWTHYRNGNYQKAFDVLSELYNTYNNPKYLYWKARSLEGTGKDATSIYKILDGKGLDFYSILANIKVGKETETNGPEFEVKRLGSISLERVSILLELELRREAVSELSDMAKKTTNANDLIHIATKLKEENEYRMALNLISRLPYQEGLHSILYPLAFWTVVREVSDHNGIDPFVVLSVMREESRFDPEARSIAGALGLMQLMPQTASTIERRVSLNIKSREQLYDIKTNITLGSYYLASLIKEFGALPVAIAAYNAGENNVRKWQKGEYKSYDEFIEDIPYDETRNYTKRVIKTYFEYLRYASEKDISSIL
jgi:soluble lytic murein transglycosylase